ncbi:MAG: TRAP transporter substrate-binding protein [Succinivibrio sp.]|jgi:tripartite ATP-independent transporter DctP family solute receptor|nr:TRAP transporter substrate-binding protein [Succinivibrio sp.]
MKKLTVTVLAAAVAFAASAANAADFAPASYRLAHTAATSHAHHQAAELFAKGVSDATGGKVKIEIYPQGELGDQPSLAEQVTMGSLDLAVVSLGNLATYSKKLSAMTAPFLFKSYDHAHKTIDGYVMKWMNDGLAEHDAYALSMFDYGFRQTTTKGIEVKSADDLKGVKIRVPPSPGLLAAFDSVGANTQQIAYSELYQSLKQGVVDGEENPVFTILADSLFETQDHLALTNHYFDCQALLINKTTFEGLSPELQKIFKDEAVKAQNLTRKLISEGEAGVIEQLKGKGMKVNDVDRDSFVKKMAPAYEKIGKLAGQDEMDALLKAAKQYE